MYGNTHTTTTVTSQQTTLYRHEAREIVRNVTNAAASDRVIFTGSGCTGAVHELSHALQLNPAKTIIFVGPYEHHSNLLPWRESGAKVIRIAEDPYGRICMDNLEKKLQQNQKKGHRLIGCFAAASNVTGILVDTNAISICLHKYGALAFWDYATAAPYVHIDMNPVLPDDDQHLAFKDAVYFSPHKFVGGVGTTGLLIAKKFLFKNSVPSVTGGGTVFYVTRESHRYLEDIETREEGGTPDIVGSIRVGLVLQLKAAVTSEAIIKRENDILHLALSRWAHCHNLVILGSTVIPRLPIFSFLIRHPDTGRFLHYNYVCVLLNDIFGIQARGGCACAGPYAEDLLGIDEDLAKEYESVILECRLDERSDNEILRPGFTRINLPYFMSDEEINFVIEALKLVSEFGWKLLPFYTFNPETGQWRHQSFQVFKDRKWLGNISYNAGFMDYLTDATTDCQKPYSESIAYAKKLFATASSIHVPLLPDQTLILRDYGECIRWFLYPSEAQQILLGKELETEVEFTPPFTPRRYQEDGVVLDEDYQNLKDNNKGSSVEHCVANLTKSHKDWHSLTSKISENDVCSICNCIITETMLEQTENKQEQIAKAVSVATKKQEGSSAVGQQQQHHQISHKGTSTTTKVHFHVPPKKIMKLAIQAIEDFGMIRQNDRVLACISGGKDSLSMLHTLRQYQFYARSKGIKFDIGATTVDPQSVGYNPRPLIQYMAELGVPYFYEEQDIIEAACLVERCDSICSFCSRLKRGRIYACARREKYNVIALGQHLDDLSESFLMSIFHNGFLRTMKASYVVQEGDLRVIRPFVYVREKELKEFAEEAKLPIIPENCPACFEAPKERHRIKQVLANQELLFPMLHHSLLSAMKPLMSKDGVGMESHKTYIKVKKEKEDDTATEQ